MLVLKRAIRTVAMAAMAVVTTMAPSVTAQNPTPVPPGVLEGLVVVPSNMPGTPPTPVPEATVEVFNAMTPQPGSTPIRRGLTDGHGRFRFEGLAAGSYIVRAFKEGVGAGHVMAQLTSSAGARVVVMLMPPPPPPPGPPPGVLEGMVVAPSITGAALPVPRATVRVYLHLSPNPNPDPIREGLTDDRGRFHFDGLRPGTYVVTAFKEGVGAGRTLAELTDRQGARVMIMLMPVRPTPPPPPGVLEGVVLAPLPSGFEPVEGATVMVFSIPMTLPNPTPIRTGTSGSDGSFRFEDLKPGRYMVVAFKKGVGRGNAYALLTEAFGARVRILLRHP
jgi:uncharacterized protein (DUF2141 family)